MSQPSANPPAPPVSPLATVYAGLPHDALTTEGIRERVTVRQLPLRHAQRYLELSVVGDDQGIIELCLGESAEWDPKFTGQHAADRFHPEAQEELLAIAHQLNFRTGEAWIARNKDNRAKLRPLLLALHSFQADLMGEAMQKMTSSLLELMEQGMERITRSLASSGAPASPSTAAPTQSSTATPSTS